MPSAEVAVVGAGAAGLMASIAAASAAPGRRVLLFDTRKKIGAKILISGGTRCNVTNVDVTPSDYNGGPSHFVKHVLAAFTPAQTIEFFKQIGVHLVLEPTGKYFPTTHSGKTVLESLTKEAERAGVELVTGVRVTDVQKTGEEFRILGSSESGAFEALAGRVILATGGLSLPETGSDGKGIEIARRLGHAIVPTTPALTPLTTPDPDWPSLSGIALDARLSVFCSGKKETHVEGALLFTHVGFSGPAALDVSRHYLRIDPADKPGIVASFLPAESEETLGRRCEEWVRANPARPMKSFFEKELKLPERFVALFFKKAKFTDGPAAKFPRDALRRLVHKLLNHPLDVSGVVGYKKAEATAGGVDLKEVSVSTMESKRVPGLYFAGEILDVDGRIGGFNFQWAWSTGQIAGRSAALGLAARAE